MANFYRKTVEKIANPIKGNNIPGVLFWLAAPLVIGVFASIVNLGLTFFMVIFMYIFGDISNKAIRYIGLTVNAVSFLMAILFVIDLWRISRK